MNLLVDTSVWSLVFRRRIVDQQNEFVIALRTHLETGDGLFIVGSILQELLSGLRGDREFARMLQALSPFPLLEPTRETYALAARISNTCSVHGIAAGTIDALITAVCLEHQLPLLTADKDFARIAGHTNLTLLPPMPTP